MLSSGTHEAGAVAAKSALSAGKKARDEWEAAKLRVKKLEQELEEGKKQRKGGKKEPGEWDENLSTLGGASPTGTLRIEQALGIEHALFIEQPPANMFERFEAAAAAAPTPTKAASPPPPAAQPIVDQRSLTPEVFIPASGAAAGGAVESFADQFSQEFAKEKEGAAAKAQARREALRKQREEDAVERAREQEERARILAEAEDAKRVLQAEREKREAEEAERLATAKTKANEAKRVAAQAKAEDARRRAAERGAEQARAEEAKVEAGRAEQVRLVQARADEERRVAEARAEAEYQAQFEAMLAGAEAETESVAALAAKRRAAEMQQRTPQRVKQDATQRVEAMWAEAEAELFDTPSRDEILMKDVERRAREESARNVQQRVVRSLEKPGFTPGYAARVKAQMQADRRYREDVVQWDKRRNEIETGLLQT